ncbi:MAG: hypothetical protein NVSMB63_18410 [Sediminibacterium sp.]
MKLLMISCKKATYLISKKEEGKLSWLEKVRLRGHLTICSLCRLFERQTGFISRNVRHLHSPDKLSEESKQKMTDSLKNP